MILSYSQIKTYQECPRQWWYKYKEKLTPISYSRALTEGGVVHRAIEIMGKDPGGTLPYGAIQSAIQEAWQGIDISLVTDEMRKNMKTLESTAIAMVTKYFDTEKDLGSTYIKREVPMIARVCDDVFYQCIADVVYVSSDNKLTYREIKTKSRITPAYLESLSISMQTCLAKQLFGFDAIEYVVIKKPEIRQRKDEDVEMFAVRLMEDVNCVVHRIETQAQHNPDLIRCIAEWMKIPTERDELPMHSHSCSTLTSTCPYLPLCACRQDAMLLYEKRD